MKTGSFTEAATAPVLARETRSFETLSVILQVGSFKIRKKRVFLMAPLHHHFEMKGWSENKIIVRFWMIALVANLIALIALKLR